MTLPFESGPEGLVPKHQLVTQRKFHGVANCCRGIFTGRDTCVGCPDDRLVRPVSCTGPQFGLIIPVKLRGQEDKTSNVEMMTEQPLKGPVMCESCAALTVLQGHRATAPKLRQLSCAAFDYDLRDQTDNVGPWVAPVQPLTNLQGRFHYLLNQQRKEVRNQWNYCRNPADDFE